MWGLQGNVESTVSELPLDFSLVLHAGHLIFTGNLISSWRRPPEHLFERRAACLVL